MLYQKDGERKEEGVKKKDEQKWVKPKILKNWLLSRFILFFIFLIWLHTTNFVRNYIKTYIV